ncbi:methyl-accepting chemotaxis protein [Blastopirellula marina]|nr:methyl-accepting chemotaxis protein [Blastopirellula marina]
MGIRTKIVLLTIGGCLVALVLTLWGVNAAEGELLRMAAINALVDSPEQVHLPLTHLKQWLLLTLAANLLVFSAVGWFVADRYFRRLKHVARGTRRIIEDGWDLTARIVPSGNDTVTEIATAINGFLDRFQALVGDVARKADRITSSSMELTSKASQVTCETTVMGQESASVSIAAEELSTNMATMAASAEEMSATSHSISSAIEQMSATVAGISRSTRDVADSARRTASLADESNQTIQALREAAKEVEKVIDVIQNIAEQTNLLALNATIESARAGEAGKGFAVVASEVRDLAKQTTEAADEVRTRIESIQTRTGETVDSITSITHAIGEVNRASQETARAVDEQNMATKEIAQSVTQFLTATDSVSNGVNDSASVCQLIAESIVRIDGAISEARGNVATSQTESRQLTEIASLLQEMAGEFRTDCHSFHAAPFKAAHGAWRVRLADMFAGNEEIAASDVASGKDCAFGKWVYTEGLKQFAGDRVFLDIERRHLQVHEFAHEIVDLFNQGEKKEAAEKFGHFRDMTDELFQLLDELEANAARQSEIQPV